MTQWTPPPPGDARDQLPQVILDLITVPPHLSTACETAQLLDQAALQHPDRADELEAWAERQYRRCRLNNKFTGQLCSGSRHDRSS